MVKLCTGLSPVRAEQVRAVVCPVKVARVQLRTNADERQQRRDGSALRDGPGTRERVLNPHAWEQLSAASPECFDSAKPPRNAVFACVACLARCSATSSIARQTVRSSRTWRLCSKPPILAAILASPHYPWNGSAIHDPVASRALHTLRVNLALIATRGGGKSLLVTRSPGEGSRRWLANRLAYRDAA